MPRNTLNDLNNHLFMQLERLNDEELKDDELQKEISRAKAVSSIAAQIINNGSLVLSIAAQIINNGSLVLRSQEFIHEYGLIESKGSGKSKSNGKSNGKKFPPMLRAEFLEG